MERTEDDVGDDERGVPTAGLATPAGLAARAQQRAERAAPDPDGQGPAGDAAVDEALRVLEGLADRPLTEHVAAFDAVHSALQDRLAEAQG